MCRKNQKKYNLKIQVNTECLRLAYLKSSEKSTGNTEDFRQYLYF